MGDWVGGRGRLTKTKRKKDPQPPTAAKKKKKKSDVKKVPFLR